MAKFGQLHTRPHGTTPVEFAITAPIAFLLFFGAYEFSRMNMVRHTMDIAAYEGAREGIVAGATAAEVTQRTNSMLSPVAVKDAVVTVTPTTINRDTPEVTVEIEVPIAPNSWITPQFLGDLRLRARSTLAREGFTNSNL